MFKTSFAKPTHITISAPMLLAEMAKPSSTPQSCAVADAFAVALVSRTLQTLAEAPVGTPNINLTITG